MTTANTGNLRAEVARRKNAPTDTDVAARGPVDVVVDQVRRMQSEFARALPDIGLTPERFVRLAITTLRQGPPELQQCTVESVLGALVTSAQLGLEPGGPLGQAWLLPFRNKDTGRYEATFSIGYKGYVALARRSGEIESVIARTVYANDLFDVDYGLDDRLVHKPNLDGESAPAIAWYAIAKYRGGGHSFVVLNRHAVERIRHSGKSANSPAWRLWYDEMACGKACKALAKWMPLTTAMATAVGADETVRLDRNVDADPSPATYDEPAETVSYTVRGELAGDAPAALPSVRPVGQPAEAHQPTAPTASEPANTGPDLEPAEPPQPTTEQPGSSDTATHAQGNRLHQLFGKMGLGGPDNRGARMAATIQIIGRDVGSSTELTGSEASRTIHALDWATRQPDPLTALHKLLEERNERR